MIDILTVRVELHFWLLVVDFAIYMVGGVRRSQPYADAQPTRHRFYVAVQYEVPYEVDDGQHGQLLTSGLGES